MPNSTPVPIWTPLLNLLRDEKFVTIVIGAIFSAIALAVPGLEPHRGTIIPLIVTLVGIAVGGQVVTNAVQIHADAKVEAAKALYAAPLQSATFPVQTVSSEFTDQELFVLAQKLGLIASGETPQREEVVRRLARAVHGSG